MNYYPFGSIMGDSTINYSIAPESQYKYSGKEFQPELDLDTYDFGARHYEPVLGRWMGIDALGLQYPGMSPYNYVANNPINLTDPDGMQHSSPISTATHYTVEISGTPLPGLGSPASATSQAGGASSALGKIGTGLQIAGAIGSFIDANIAFSQKVTQNNLNVSGVQGNRINATNNAYNIPNSNGGPTGGKVNSFEASFAFGGGYSFEIGTVRDAKNNIRWFISHGPTIGFSLGAGFSEKSIAPTDNKNFELKDYPGSSSGYSIGFLVYGIEHYGNRTNTRYRPSDWRWQGKNYNQIGAGAFQGGEIGLTWSRTNTRFISQKIISL